MLLNIRLAGWAGGIFAAFTYILCIIYGLTVPERLHGMSTVLEAILPAFRWLTPGGFILGLAESFLYGAYIAGGFALIYNFLIKRSY